MAAIPFDDGVARALQTAANDAMNGLRAQTQPRQTAANAASQDFEGVYAELFLLACTDESGDRMRLAEALEDLVSQVGWNIRRAEEERARQRDWAERVEIAEKLGDTGVFFLPDGVPMPAEFSGRWVAEVSEPIRPLPLSVRFSARERARNGGRDGSRSSADPEALRNFVEQGRRFNEGLRDIFGTLQGRWAAFSSACSWVPMDEVNFIAGFGTLVIENEQDVLWVGRIADAFERAGSGSLTDTTITAIANNEFPPAFLDLLRTGASPEQVAQAWKRLGWDAAKVQSLPVDVQYMLSNLNGLSATVRDVASRAVLKAARERPEEIYFLMGVTGVSVEVFAQQITSLQDSLVSAEKMARKDLLGTGNQVAQLVGLGVDRGSLVVALSLGNLDTASNLAVNVPGVQTDVTSMDTNLQAMNNLLINAQSLNRNASFAGVAWIGAKTPSALESGTGGMARAGGARLAGFLDGMYAGRGENVPERVTVAGHSYGATMAAEGVRRVKNQVEALVTYGSVGIEREAVGGLTSINDLNADKVYATEAGMDPTAWWGRLLTDGARKDPRNIPGVEEFSSLAGDGTKAVTEHDMYPGAPKVGYLSPDAASQRGIAKIIAGLRP